ncbi:MAG: energy transducer TonB [Akkermansiaceae bacterium]|jgi:protein TonB|nr:energy transducer TonB [Akkermansiaceae bacterium]MCU0777452.1 energy transducer TonB [Akkermansiaceae bacterium]
MQSLIHSLNIGTLATWLSVAGFGTVGVVVPQWQAVPAPVVAKETRLFDEDFTLGDPGTPESEGEAADSVAPQFTESQPDTLPAPPDLPPLAEFEPLPEVPDLPPAAARAADLLPKARSEAGRSAVGRSSASTASRSGSSRPTGNLKTGGSGGSGGLSESARLAAGRMPAPSYPAECRRKGQTGTVVVEFTVDSSGRVIAAHAKSESPWPLLNHEAVRTVRRWKFPPGGIMKLQRPIVFQLR